MTHQIDLLRQVLELLDACESETSSMTESCFTRDGFIRLTMARRLITMARRLKSLGYKVQQARCKIAEVLPQIEHAETMRQRIEHSNEVRRNGHGMAEEKQLAEDE